MLVAQIWHKLFNIPQVIFAIGGLVAIAAIIASQWYKVQKLQSENRLKRTLAERGMSADEIERIIDAQTRPNDSDG